MNAAQQLVGSLGAAVGSLGAAVGSFGTLLQHWVHTTTGPSARDSQHAGPVHSAGHVSQPHSMSSSELRAAGPGASAPDAAGAASGGRRRRRSSDARDANSGDGQHAAPAATPAAAARASHGVDAQSGRMPDAAPRSPVLPRAAPFPAHGRASASARPNNAAPAGSVPSAAPLRTPASASPATAPPRDRQKRVTFVWSGILQVRFPFSSVRGREDPCPYLTVLRGAGLHLW